MAEIELGVLDRQCLDRRIGDPETLRQQVGTWERDRNASTPTANARIKLRKLYPSLDG